MTIYHSQSGDKVRTHLNKVQTIKFINYIKKKSVKIIKEKLMIKNKTAVFSALSSLKIFEN